MSLVHRIVGGFVVLLLALLTLVFISYYSIATVESDIGAITEQTIPLSEQANKVKLHIVQQDQSLMAIYSTDNLTKVESYKVGFQQHGRLTVEEIKAIPHSVLSRNSGLQQELDNILKRRESYTSQANALIALRKREIAIEESINQELQLLSNLKRRMFYYLNKYTLRDKDEGFQLNLAGLAREVTRILAAFEQYTINKDIDKLITSIQGGDIVIEKNFNEIRRYNQDIGKLFSLMIEPILQQLRAEQGLYNLYRTQYHDALEAQQLLESNSQNIAALLTSVEAFIQQADDMVIQAEQSTKNSITLMQQTMLTISAVAVFIAVIVPSWIAAWMRKTLRNFRNALLQMAEGNLRVQFPQTGKDEFSELGGYLNGLADNLRVTFDSLNHSAGELTKVADQNAVISERTTAAVSQQRTLLESTASAMTEMESSVSEIAQRAHETMSSAEQAQEKMGNVSISINQAISNIKQQAEQIGQTSQTTQELNEYGMKIDRIIETIQNIAEQTNLLALNAAIEAARAGQQGRGFAVVADEVRSLASRTKSSTEEIQNMIEVMQRLIKAVVDNIAVNVSTNDSNIAVAEEAELGIEQMANSIRQIVDMNMQIAAATEEQSTTAKEISVSVVHISDSAEETYQGANDNARSSQLLHEQSVQQRQLIEQFEV